MTRHYATADAKTEDEKNEAWRKDGVESSTRRAAYERDYKMRFHADMIMLYDALKARVGDSNEARKPVLLDVGMLAGPSPIQEAADYLDSMAGRLE